MAASFVLCKLGTLLAAQHSQWGRMVAGVPIWGIVVECDYACLLGNSISPREH